MTDKLVKVVGSHIPNCSALKNRKSGLWTTEWGPIAFGEYGDPVVTTKRRYGKNWWAFRYWLRFVCNDPSCRAELHVEKDFILNAAKKVKS